MNISFETKLKGFSATISGVSADDLRQKVNECLDGKCSCNCDPEIMNKIEHIEVLAHKDGSKINITGDVNVQSIAPMMQSCLLQKD